MKVERKGFVKYHHMLSKDTILKKVPYTCENDDCPMDELHSLIESAMLSPPANYYVIGVELEEV